MVSLSDEDSGELSGIDYNTPYDQRDQLFHQKRDDTMTQGPLNRIPETVGLVNDVQDYGQELQKTYRQTISDQIAGINTLKQYGS